MLTCQLLKDEKDIASLREPWDALQKEQGLSPFTSFDWVWSWQQTSGKKESATLLVIACFEEDRLVGLLPLATHKKYGVSILRFACHDASYIRNILAKTEDVERTLWQEALALRAYDFADIKNIHEGTPSQKLLASSAFCFDKSPVYYREHPGEKRETLYKVYTKRFRRKLNRIKEEIDATGLYTYGVSDDESLLKEALPFLVEEKRKWCEEKDKNGIFDQESVDAFYKGACEAAIKQNIMRLFWLRKEGKLIAVLLCFLGGDTLYAHTTAHDPAARKIRPGLFLKAEAMIWAAENGFRETNFMEGQEFFKIRFCPDFRTTYEYIYARTLKGWLFLIAYKARDILRKLKRRNA